MPRAFVELAEPPTRDGDGAAPTRPESCAASVEPDATVLPASSQTLRWWHWVLLSSVSVLGPFSTDSYVPNMPQMAAELQCTQFLAGLTLQINLLVSGLAKVPIGRASDTWGRRPTLLATLAVYTVATVASSVAPSIEWLIAARALQACSSPRSIVWPVLHTAARSRALVELVAQDALPPILTAAWRRAWARRAPRCRWRWCATCSTRRASA